MFTDLAPLVRASDKVVVTLSMQGDLMSVVVVPVIKNAADAALTTPLALSATPAELDAGFADVVCGVSSAHRSLAEQAEATRSILDAAKSSQSTKATKALAKAAPKSSSTDGEDGDDDDDAQASDRAVSQTEAKAEESVPPSTGTDLASLL